MLFGELFVFIDMKPLALFERRRGGGGGGGGAYYYKFTEIMHELYISAHRHIFPLYFIAMYM